MLGVLTEVHPSEMVNNSDKLYKAYLGELKEQVWLTYMFGEVLCSALLTFEAINLHLVQLNTFPVNRLSEAIQCLHQWK